MELTSGNAFASRTTINVIFPRAGDAAGNNTYPKRGKRPVVEQVRQRVLETITDVSPGWATKFPDYKVLVRPNFVERGVYHYTVVSDAKQ